MTLFHGANVAANCPVNFGYKHGFLRGNEGAYWIGSVESRALHGGAFVVGGSYRINDHARVSLNFEIGSSGDSPGFLIGLRLPISPDPFRK